MLREVTQIRTLLCANSRSPRQPSVSAHIAHFKGDIRPSQGPPRSSPTISFYPCSASAPATFLSKSIGEMRLFARPLGAVPPACLRTRGSNRSRCSTKQRSCGQSRGLRNQRGFASGGGGSLTANNSSSYPRVSPRRPRSPGSSLESESASVERCNFRPHHRSH